MARLGLLAACCAALARGQVNRAVARMRGTTAAYAGVGGYVLFEQPADAVGLQNITVHVQVTGVTPGTHGFHVTSNVVFMLRDRAQKGPRA